MGADDQQRRAAQSERQHGRWDGRHRGVHERVVSDGIQRRDRDVQRGLDGNVWRGNIVYRGGVTLSGAM